MIVYGIMLDLFPWLFLRYTSIVLAVHDTIQSSRVEYFAVIGADARTDEVKAFTCA